MNIIIARYKLAYDSLCFLEPIPVKRETEKCYWSREDCCGTRVLKSEIGVVKHKDVTTYPYLEVKMIDATEEELRDKIAEWFTERANEIKSPIKRNKTE